MTPERGHPPGRVTQDPLYVRCILIAVAVGIITLFVVIPLLNVFWNAFAGGAGAYWAMLVDDPDTRHAILLTLTVAPVAVLVNVVFGVAAAWTIARFRFPGRTLLVTLIDVPFSVSPVVAGRPPPLPGRAGPRRARRRRPGPPRSRAGTCRPRTPAARSPRAASRAGPRARSRRRRRGRRRRRAGSPA